MTAALRSQLRKRLLLVALSIFSSVLALLFVEAAARIRQWFKYGSAGNTVYSTTVDPASGLEIPTPGHRTRTISINSRGFRGPELVIPKPRGRIRLAFLGESTTFCAEVSSNEATWPHLVWKSLQDSWPTMQFDYVNAGVPGYGVTQSLRNLEYRVKPLHPDVIVIYHAINDLSKDARALAVQQGLFDGKSVVDHSLVGRWSLAYYLVATKYQMIRRGKRATELSGRLDFDPPTFSRGFHHRLRELVEASKAAAPVVAVATYSQWVRRNQAPEDQLRACQSTIYYNPFMSVEGILKGVEEYNRVIRDVARETGVILVEGENNIPGDERHYNDSVHFKDAGAKIMAQRVMGALMRSEPFNRLVSSRQRSPAGQK